MWSNSNEIRLPIIDTERRRMRMFVIVHPSSTAHLRSREDVLGSEGLSLSSSTSPASSDNYFDVGRSTLLSTDDYFNWLCLFFCSFSLLLFLLFPISLSLSLFPMFPSSLSLWFLLALKTATSRPLFFFIFSSHPFARCAIISFYWLDIAILIFLFRTI